MQRKMLNLYTDQSLEAVWSAAAIHAMARAQQAGVYVRHCACGCALSTELHRLAHAIQLSRDTDFDLPARSVYFHRVVPRRADIAALKSADPAIVLCNVDQQVPFDQLSRVALLLALYGREDVEGMCANAIYLSHLL